MSRFLIYDDPGARALRPLTRLRPASQLLLGAMTTQNRWRALAGEETVAVVCRDLLAPLEPGRLSWSAAFAAAGDAGHGPWEAGTLWISDLVLPDEALLRALQAAEPDTILRLEGVLAGFRTGPEIRRAARDAAVASGAAVPAANLPAANLPAASLSAAVPLSDFLERIARVRGARCADLAGMRLSGLGDLQRFHEQLLPADLEWILSKDPAAPGAPGPSMGDGFAYRPEAVRLGTGCRIDAGAVLDAREGPVVLGPGCEVFPHTWIRGPFHAGPGCRLLGGKLGGSSLGPGCRVRGEVEASVFLGYDNKTHDGFVGHSYLGEWVNLGALTTTSDLKNNYGPVILEGEDGPVETGLRKMGVVLGDHVKTRIGALLTCGTVVGLGASLAGDPCVPKRWIPDFAWVVPEGDGASEYEINKFLKTAETVMARRGRDLTPALSEALRAVHHETREAGKKEARPKAARSSSGIEPGGTKSQSGS
jgi:UDP-N-acetylglucosamine diphosphorylase/glucosamine-1-phosphate N-acetyltransferase